MTLGKFRFYKSRKTKLTASILVDKLSLFLAFLKLLSYYYHGFSKTSRDLLKDMRKGDNLQCDWIFLWRHLDLDRLHHCLREDVKVSESKLKRKAIGDKLGVVDDQDVKEDTDGHDGCGRVHQVGAQPRWKISDSTNWVFIKWVEIDVWLRTHMSVS